MNIDNVLSSLSNVDRTVALPKAETPQKGENNVDFGTILKNAISEVSGSENEANELVKKFAAGDIQDVHQVMIALEKANMSLNFSLQVRNKIIDAYQEIMRMQM